MPGRVQGYHKLKENPVWILVIKHTKHKSYHLWAFFFFETGVSFCSPGFLGTVEPQLVLNSGTPLPLPPKCLDYMKHHDNWLHLK